MQPDPQLTDALIGVIRGRSPVSQRDSRLGAGTHQGTPARFHPSPGLNSPYRSSSPTAPAPWLRWVIRKSSPNCWRSFIRKVTTGCKWPMPRLWGNCRPATPPTSCLIYCTMRTTRACRRSWPWLWPVLWPAPAEMSTTLFSCCANPHRERYRAGPALAALRRKVGRLVRSDEETLRILDASSDLLARNDLAGGAAPPQ